MALTEHQQAELKSNHDHRLETYKSMILISTEFFKYMALLNGGAAAGMVATMDKLQPIIGAGSMRLAIGSFVFGLISNGCAMFCSYLTQNMVFGEAVGRPNTRDHGAYLVAGGAFSILSLAAFCVGAIGAVFGIKY